MSAPTVEIRCEVTHSSPCPRIPPRFSIADACQNEAAGARPGPTPSVPAASASVIEHVKQIVPVRNGRPGGRISRISTSPPATTSADGTTYPSAPNRNRRPVTAPFPSAPPSHWA